MTSKIKDTIHSIGTITLGFSILVFLGGLMGFFLKKSLPSLFGGSLCGLTLLLLSTLTFTYKKWSLYTSLAVILFLDIFFSYRFLLNYKFFPAGLMLIISTLTLILLISKLKKLNDLSKKLTN